MKDLHLHVSLSFSAVCMTGLELATSDSPE